MLSVALILLLSLMLPGVINRTRAVLAGRRGVRFYQHVYNVELLLRKGAVYSPTTTLLFRAAPSVYLATALCALLFVPVGGMAPLLAFRGDVVVFVYLLALGRLALILAAMDMGSSFEGMGASREALYGALVEPALFVVLGTLALVTGNTSFGAVFSTFDAVDGGMAIVVVLLAYVVFRILTVEAGRIPVDDPRTHLELTMIHEVMVLDYSGPDLAMINLGGWFKTGALAVIAADIFAGLMPMSTAVVCGAALLVGVVIGTVESFQARNRMSRNTTYILTILAVAILVFMVALIIMKS